MSIHLSLVHQSLVQPSIEILSRHPSSDLVQLSRPLVVNYTWQGCFKCEEFVEISELSG
jgi:hypothetical protein